MSHTIIFITREEDFAVTISGDVSCSFDGGNWRIANFSADRNDLTPEEIDKAENALIDEARSNRQHVRIY